MCARSRLRQLELCCAPNCPPPRAALARRPALHSRDDVKALEHVHPSSKDQKQYYKSDPAPSKVWSRPVQCLLEPHFHGPLQPPCECQAHRGLRSRVGIDVSHFESLERGEGALRSTARGRARCGDRSCLAGRAADQIKSRNFPCQIRNRARRQVQPRSADGALRPLPRCANGLGSMP